jgi:hypothetical protein
VCTKDDGVCKAPSVRYVRDSTDRGSVLSWTTNTGGLPIANPLADHRMSRLSNCRVNLRVPSIGRIDGVVGEPHRIKDVV